MSGPLLFQLDAEKGVCVGGGRGEGTMIVQQNVKLPALV
jgi:hypothetical protein